MKTRLTIITVFLGIVAFGQIGGNQLYQNQNSENLYYQNSNSAQTQNFSKIRTDQNKMTFEVNVLNNVRADSYVVTLGVNQESHSVETCNAKINQRIASFITEIKKLGIKEKDIYVDFVTQTKIYGYQSNSEGTRININQKDDGFEIKKNVIFKIENILLFDKIVEIASKSEIHNIVNVEYYVLNQDLVYEAMLEEAMNMIEKRKNLLKTEKSKWELDPVYEISFSSVQPGSQYKKFQAFETSNISYSNYYNSDKVIVQQEQRKSNTFFFDGLPTANFDKIMNADTAIVGLQYVMNVRVTYEATEKEKKQFHIITPNGDLKLIDLN